MKTAIVTGGSRGIGKAIANRLLMDGYSVHICGRNSDDLRDATEKLSLNGHIDWFQLDLSNRDEVAEMCKEWTKPIDSLVNNAGISGTERLDEGMDLWEEIMATNLHGLYRLTHDLLPFIRKGGSIINISSQLGLKGRVGFGAYCASKHALLGLTKSWAMELGEKGIRVNAVCPGWVKTEMAMADLERIADEKGMSSEDQYSEISSDLDLRRFIEPEEVAKLVSFLISEKASGITGQSYPIK